MPRSETAEPSVPAAVTIAAPDGRTFRLSRPRPAAGPWRPHERAAARTLGPQEHEHLMPLEAFDDEAAGDEDLHRLLDEPDPALTGPDSRTVRLRLRSSCAGWARRPEPAELYAAIRSSRPTERERSLLRMWANEPEWLELIQAWAERVYTLRELAAALHRAGITRSRHSRTLNRWAARRPPAP